jgi:hypothetical protein
VITLRNAVCTGAALLLLSGGIVSAKYDGPVDPEIHKWAESLTNGNGNACCAYADGYAAEDWGFKSRTNGYWVRINGEKYDVPDSAVVKRPNRLGEAIVWYYITSPGNAPPTLTIRCFIAGPGT